MEIWKDIVGFEGYYQVSNLGRVKRLPRTSIRSNGKSDHAIYRVKERIKNPQIQTQGYYHVALYRDGEYKICRLNRVVAIAFIPNPENKPEVNHKDGNKLNNRADNLEWVTGKENKKHARENGLIKPYKRKILQFDESWNLLSEFESIKDAAEAINGSRGNICVACRGGRGGKAYGFYWRYKDARK